MVRVKICGITNADDALFAAGEGADALGFIFAKSPRKVSAAAVQRIIRSVGPLVAGIGVFVDESVDNILRTADRCRLIGVQLHGSENAAMIRKLQKNGLGVIKAVRVGEGMDLKRIDDFPADALLFDTARAGKFGGTGRRFDWTILKTIRPRAPWIVSGGLDAGNVQELLRTLKPYGVDVSSGVEISPGKKSKKLVKEFIRNAKSPR